MTVFVLERVTPMLRGRLTRWMLEVHPGIFVGSISSRVREQLWDVVRGARRTGAVTMIFRTPTEQGFTMDTAGDPRRVPLDFDGLQLLLRREPAKAK